MQCQNKLQVMIRWSIAFHNMTECSALGFAAWRLMLTSAQNSRNISLTAACWTFRNLASVCQVTTVLKTRTPVPAFHLLEQKHCPRRNGNHKKGNMFLVNHWNKKYFTYCAMLNVAKLYHQLFWKHLPFREYVNITIEAFGCEVERCLDSKAFSVLLCVKGPTVRPHKNKYVCMHI